MTLAIVFPGQGSQSVGMLAALAAAEPLVQQTFAEASGVLGYDLWELCRNGPEADLHKSTAGMARALDAKPEQAAEHLVSKMTPEAKQAMATELVKQASDEVEKAVERTGGAVLSPTGADVGTRANASRQPTTIRPKSRSTGPASVMPTLGA